jgi:hypothetical protein
MEFALDDKDPCVRAAAVKVLGNFHQSQDSEAIATLLNDPLYVTSSSTDSRFFDHLPRTLIDSNGSVGALA